MSEPPEQVYEFEMIIPCSLQNPIFKSFGNLARIWNVKFYQDLNTCMREHGVKITPLYGKGRYVVPDQMLVQALTMHDWCQFRMTWL